MGKFGIEKESIRIDKNGAVSNKNHPLALGSKLTHPNFTTDFGEAQTEFVTKPHTSIQKTLNELSNLQRYFYITEKSELLWPLSMPPPLKKIRIADYGNSDMGKEKVLYREGLAHRYPIQMQMISGVHANYSFEKKLTSDEMMGIIRNFLRYGWLLSYLFGASPFMHQSFVSKKPKKLKKFKDLYIGPYATSLRLSPFGYYSRIQNQLSISYNHLDEYIAGIEKALTTPHKPYSGQGLNANLLQIPGELYSRIRPKTSHKSNRFENGIDYLEVRALDLNPYDPLGASQEELNFTWKFLQFCNAQKSPPFTKAEIKKLTTNQCLVALYGRDPELQLLTNKGGKKLTTWARELVHDIDEAQIEKIENPNLTHSAKLLKDLEKRKSLNQLGIDLAKGHKKALLKKPLPLSDLNRFKTAAADSLKEQDAIEQRDQFILKGYEDLEHSTQVLIRKAKQQKIDIEVLDRPHSIIRLKKGKQTHIVQQATKTHLDTYIAPLIMDNKAVTKQLLDEAGLNIPKGLCFDSLAAAKRHFIKGKVVIKPNTANFGLGIHFAKTQKDYEKALNLAFYHAPSVVVETFCPGKEYRFLVIDHKVIGVLYREPANVTGDGKSTIRALVTYKNCDPKSFKPPKEQIRLGAIEKAFLKTQKLAPTSIPKKGRKIYLRENSNISTGGDPIDVTDTMHLFYKTLAIKAADVVDAKICGVDMLIPAPHKKGSYAIIELNYNPTLSMHAYPFQGKPRDGAGPILDLLFS